MTTPTTEQAIAEAMGRLSSYPQIYAIGHAAIGELFDGPVQVEEKIDGSQFSFGLTVDGILRYRSKGKQIEPGAPEPMFERAIATADALAPDLRLGWTYRGEYLQKPKHNALCYSRVPEQHIILFDVETAPQQFLSPDERFTEADRLGLEVVPVLYEGVIGESADLLRLLEGESCLGGVAPEGVVAKNYARFGKDKKVLMGKYVSEAFKEIHDKEWKVANPTRTDVVQGLIQQLKTDARWRKAVQHLKEAGALEGSPRDIGALIREVPNDILKECEPMIRDALFAHAWPQIRRAVTAGLPEWYKRELLASAFEQAPPAVTL